MHVLLSGVVGSTAYGLAHAGSDIDRLGVFALPTEELHGLRRPAESCVTARPDRTFHEVGKWCRLALAGNPTVTELVWLPDELYEVRTALGDQLIALREAFLSEQAVRSAYLGYARQQFRKVCSRDRSSRDRAAKNARHLVRLVLQAEELHATGRLTVRLRDPERVRELGERFAEVPERAAEFVAAAEARLAGPGALPAAPDEAAVEAWLRRVRAAFYVPPEQAGAA
jgi:uncharacterized protein